MAFATGPGRAPAHDPTSILMASVFLVPVIEEVAATLTGVAVQT